MVEELDFYKDKKGAKHFQMQPSIRFLLFSYGGGGGGAIFAYKNEILINRKHTSGYINPLYMCNAHFSGKAFSLMMYKARTAGSNFKSLE